MIAKFLIPNKDKNKTVLKDFFSIFNKKIVLNGVKMAKKLSI